MKALMLAAVLVAAGAQADTIALESKRSMLVDAKLGLYTPMIDRAFTATPGPYQTVFSGQPMLMGELTLEYQVFQKVGSLSLGGAAAYAEKYAHALDAATGAPAAQSTGLRLFQFKGQATYRFDYAALHWNVPLVPYAKFSLIAAPWWATSGTDTELADGLPGNGVKYGLGGTFGLALQLDFLDPRLARDFDTGMGVNHSYFFAEFDIQEVNDFTTTKAGELDLSSRHWMFGFAFEM